MVNYYRVNRLVCVVVFIVIHIDKGALDAFSTLSFVINIHAEQHQREYLTSRY